MTTDFELARPNHNKLLEMIENNGMDPQHVLEDLLSFLPDDDIGEFIHSQGYDIDDYDVDDANSKMEEYFFKDVEDGYGWVTLGKALDDLEFDYDMDYIDEDMLTTFANNNDIEIKEYKGEKIFIVNESLDFELDILPDLE